MDNKLQVKTENGLMEIEVLDITPKYAKELLGYNTENRAVRKNRVTMYKKDIESGNWKANGVPIIIGNDGVLKDGQHRLIACVQSETTLKNQILIRLPKEDANCYDIGATRSTKDVASLEGVNEPYITNPSILAAVGYAYSRAHGNTNAVTKMEVVSEAIKYKEACEYIYYTLYTRHGKINGIIVQGVIATIFNAYINGVDKTILDRFCKLLIDGIPESDEDISIIKLRDYLMTYRYNGRGYANDTYYRCQKTLYNYIKGKPIIKYVVDNKEYYTLPTGGNEENE